MPSSRTVGRISSSRSRVNSDYSLWSAVIGCTAWARRIVSAAASDRPRWRTLPASTSSGHRADGLLDRDRRVDPVLVVEVDVVDAEPLQRGVARGPDVVGAAVDADPAAVGVALVAELGGELDLVAAAGDGLADELLVGERAVHVGGVEEGHAEVERAVDGRDAGLPRRRCRRTPTSPCSRGRGRRRRGRRSRCRVCVVEVVMPSTQAPWSALQVKRRASSLST